MEVILSTEMRPYYKSLKEKFTKEVNAQISEFTNITYPDSTMGKYVRLFGLDLLLDGIENPEDITVLQIDNKSDTSIDIKIPDSIASLTNLESLIFHNCISKLPDVIGTMNSLMFLNVTGNKNLKTLPGSLANLTCVTFISLKDSGVTREALPAEFLEAFVQDDEDSDEGMRLS